MTAGDEARPARFRRAWQQFFEGASQERAEAASEDQTAATSREHHQQRPSAERVRQRHEADLLSYPHVVGVDVGPRMRCGEVTAERCIRIFVRRKVPESQLAEEEVLPVELEGIGVDVIEVGTVRPLTR